MEDAAHDLVALHQDRDGLFFVDGHADFYQPEAEPNGEVASMDLAVVSGRGPAVLTDIDGRPSFHTVAHLRARVWYTAPQGGVSSQWVETGSLAGGTTASTLNEVFDGLMTTPKLQLLGGSSVINAAEANGQGLILQAQASVLAGPAKNRIARMRLYNPSLRVVG